MKWFGHMERMDEYHVASRVLMVRLEGLVEWMKKVALGSRGITVEAAGPCAKYRKKWRALLHIRR